MKTMSDFGTKIVLASLIMSCAAFEVRATTYYVAPNGDDGAAGTEGAPIKSLSVALAKEDVTEVRLAAGDYADMAVVQSPFNAAAKIAALGVVDKAVKIIGAGAEKTVLHCRKGDLTRAGGLYVNHAEAEISGLTVVDHTAANVQYNYGFAIHVIAGTVHDCSFTKCASQEMCSAVRLEGDAAVMRDCAITNNVAATNCKYTPGVTLAKGLLKNCLIADNCGGDGTSANGLYVSGGTAENCIIRNNDGANTYNTRAGGVQMAGGSLIGCTVSNNVCSSHYMSSVSTIAVGGIYASGASVISNCVVRDNRNFCHNGLLVAGLAIDNNATKVYDTEIEDNVVAGGPHLYMKGSCLLSGCTVKYGDGGEIVRQLGGELVDCTIDDGTAGDLRPATTYVSLTGSDTAPYDDPSKATRSLQKAVDAVKIGGTVIVASGNYTDNLDLRPTIKDYRRNVVITKPVTVLGPADASAVFTYRNNTDHSCGIQVGCTNALVSGLTLTGYFKQNGATYFEHCGSVLHLHEGTVSNCVVTGCSCASHVTQPVAVTGGLMTHTTIRDNAYTTTGRGCQGLWISDGVFARGAVLRNTITLKASDQATADGVIMKGGTVRDSIIEGNAGGASSTGISMFAAGVRMEGGTLERCIVQNNINQSATQAKHAGGVTASAGTIRNCLIAGNSAATTSADSAGGLYVNSKNVTVEHCTLVANGSTAGEKGAYLADGASMKACVADDGVTCVTGSADVYTEGVNFLDPSVAFPVTWENVNAYSITATSAGYNAVRQNYVTDDLLGMERPTVYDGCEDFPDAGAMEKVAVQGIVALVDPGVASLPKGAKQVFTVSIDGDDTQLASCEWTVTFGVESKTETVYGNTYEFTAEKAGSYVLSVKVTNASGEVSPEKNVQVTSMPRTCFVAMDGASISPYDEPAKAATNFADAVAAVYGAKGDPGTVYVAAGGYTNRGTMVTANGYTVAASLEKPVRLIATEGPSRTFVSFNSTDDVGGGFLVGDDDALLAGFTVSGIVATDAVSQDMWATIGSGATLTKGTISNCVFAACKSKNHWLPAVTMSAGTLVASTVGPNAMTGTGRGVVGLNVTGGTVTNCTISGNILDPTATSPDMLYAAGVRISGTGKVTDCAICSNRMVSAKYYHASYGAYATAAGALVKGGTLENCRVFDNAYSMTYYATANNYDAAGVTVDGDDAVVRGCLITGNRSANTMDQAGAGLTIGNGLVDHVTIAGNGQLDGVGTIGGLGVRGGEVKNTIAWGNEAGDLSVSGGSVVYSCAPEASEGEGNVTVNPGLVDNWRHHYEIRTTSPCARKGEKETYMGYAVPFPGGLVFQLK